MKVVEIGCGRSPGPRFETADEYYILDPNEAAVTAAARENANFIPIIGSAAVTNFESSSIDVVVARNVFGDPELFQSTWQGKMSSSLRTSQTAHRQLDIHSAVRVAMRQETNKLKLGIAAEIARILSDRGEMVVVEDITPGVASQFFTDHTKQLRSSGLIVAPALLKDIAPQNYAQYHLSKGKPVETWLGSKALQEPNF